MNMKNHSNQSIELLTAKNRRITLNKKSITEITEVQDGSCMIKTDSGSIYFVVNPYSEVVDWYEGPVREPSE